MKEQKGEVQKVKTELNIDLVSILKRLSELERKVSYLEARTFQLENKP